MISGTPLKNKVSLYTLLVASSWCVAAFGFAALAKDTPARALTTHLCYWSTATFAFVGAVWAARQTGGRERGFWALFAAGLLTSFCGYLLWQMGPDGSRLALPRDLSYTLSYLLLFLALLYLLGLYTRGIAPLAPLDALSVMFSSGMVVWYFLLAPAAPVHGKSPGEIADTLSGPAIDAGLLFLCLTLLSSRSKPGFSGWLAGGFLALVAGDLAWAGLEPFKPYEPGRWPELLWTLGLVLFVAAALRASSEPQDSQRTGISPWRVFLFWAGPLSPAVQYAFLLAWATLHPPVPAYVSWTGVVLMLYLALRISALSYINRSLRLEAERDAVRREQRRISSELHDSLKQNVYGATLLLETCRKARDQRASERLLEEALSACRESGHLLESSIEELHARCENSGVELDALLQRTLRDISSHFGVHAHQDLRADCGTLDTTRRAAAYRIAAEALWNAAKHSRASNVWLESRKVGRVLLLRVRDDGRGFDPTSPTPGVGLSLMRSRAEEAGGTLDIFSSPNRGTTVQVRFELG